MTRPMIYLDDALKAVTKTAVRWGVTGEPAILVATKAALRALPAAPQPVAVKLLQNKEHSGKRYQGLLSWLPPIGLDGEAAIEADLAAIQPPSSPVDDSAGADPVANAARVLLKALGDFDRNRSNPAFEAAMIGQRDSTKPAPFNQIGDGLIAALRAIAGGE